MEYITNNMKISCKILNIGFNIINYSNNLINTSENLYNNLNNYNNNEIIQGFRFQTIIDSFYSGFQFPIFLHFLYIFSKIYLTHS